MRMRHSYQLLQDAVEKDNDPKKRVQVSPLFKRQEQEFISLHHENIFYGYRTTMKHKRDKGSLLTVKAFGNTTPKRLMYDAKGTNKHGARPMTSRGYYPREAGLQLKGGKDFIIK